MHLGISFSSGGDLVHQPFKPFLLFSALQCPSFFVTHFAGRIPESKAEKVLQSRFANEWISFYICKHVADRRFRQSTKPRFLGDRQNGFMYRFVLRTSLYLNARLFPHM